MIHEMMPKQAQVGLLLAGVRRRQRQAVEARVRHLGLSSQQFWVLDAVLQSGECTLGHILSTLPMDQPTTSRVLSALEQRHLVETESDSADRRRRCVRLTADGRRLAKTCAGIAQRVRKALLLGFSPTDVEALTGYLSRLVENLDRLDALSPPAPREDRTRALAKPRAGGSYRARP
jgi:MarR family transcriptional regulator, transcriptional regulator for hemolysin